MLLPEGRRTRKCERRWAKATRRARSRSLPAARVATIIGSSASDLEEKEPVRVHSRPARDVGNHAYGLAAWGPSESVEGPLKPQIDMPL